MNRYHLLLLLPLIFNIAMGQSIGVFSLNKDIGTPKLKGQATYNKETQTYSVSGAGYNIWFERDEFNYLYNKLSGDFILTANFRFKEDGVDAHRKVGWMIRASEGVISSRHNLICS